MYEGADRSLFYRKALGLRRYFENCDLYPHKGKALYPSGTVRQKMRIVPAYMQGLSFADGEFARENPALSEMLCRDFGKYTSTVPKAHTVAGDMYNHSMPCYERVLKEGLLSYRARIEKIEDRDIREGLAHLLEGIAAYVRRCIDYLKSVSADEKLIAALENVPLHPARNIYEAVLAWNFILYLDGCDNLGCVAAGLYPYYRGEDAVPLLENLFDNLDVNGGYSMALSTDYNPLTLQCLEASKGRRRPMIELFVGEKTPDHVWQKAFDVIRTANGQPAFYSEGVLSGLLRRFPRITPEDARKFCGGGCTESMLAGLCNVGSLDAGVHLLRILEQELYARLEEAVDFESFYKSYLDSVRAVVEEVTEQINVSRMNRAKYNPVPMRTLLTDDCIDRGLDYYDGGARYSWSVVNFAGLINVIDGLLVIRDLAFGADGIGPKALLEGLHNNDESLLTRLRKHPVSYGSDQKEVNAFAGGLSEAIFAMLDDTPLWKGEGFLPASIQFMSQVGAGAPIGATPDGRAAGAPLCDSLGAIFGKDRKGPTALLNSVTALDLKRALGIPVMNFNIEPDFKDEVLKALILGYMDQGGLQLQITCVSREMLEEAWAHPELHGNLVVRVGGYSEYFCRLSDELKRMVIARTIYK